MVNKITDEILNVHQALLLNEYASTRRDLSQHRGLLRFDRVRHELSLLREPATRRALFDELAYGLLDVGFLGF
ncbi:MAG TPA: hypothetical protein VF131_09085 [Blastocatellia bacterium]|nr:hypothetical protein [Blastocatellia bacterium]